MKTAAIISKKVDNMDIIYKKLHEPFLKLEKDSLKDFKW